MCGIVAVIKDSYEDVGTEIAEGLKRVQYRGYDSWGMALFNGDRPPVIERSLSKEIIAPLNKLNCYAGIGHTRWATHGTASIENAHPIKSYYGGIYIVHNGIVENVEKLRQWLFLRDLGFRTDTDTEIIANYIERQLLYNKNIEQVLMATQAVLQGSSSFAFYAVDYPDKLFFMNLGQPLYVAPGYIVSDKDSLPKHIDKCYTTQDGDAGWVSHDLVKFVFGNSTKELKEPDSFVRSKIKYVDGYHMFSEMKEQETLGSYENLRFLANKPSSISLYGCGSSYYAGMFGKLLLNKVAKISTNIDYASEIKDNLSSINVGGFSPQMIAISQSGETKDVIDVSVKANKLKDYINFSLITNNSESTLAKLAKNVYNINAGKELGVAATKTFLGTCLIFKAMAFKYAKLPINDHEELLKNIHIGLSYNIGHIVSILSKYNNILILGAGYNYPIALESALKLKEVAYIHAEAVLGSEIKHGPIALIDKNTATIVINNPENRSVVDNIREIKARGGYIVGIGQHKDEEMRLLIDETISLPESNEINFALSAAVVMQSIAYQLAVLKGYNPDMPRNLAKSVTV